MRRLIAPLVVAGFLATACASASPAVESAALPLDAGSEVADDAVSAAPIQEPTPDDELQEELAETEPVNAEPAASQSEEPESEAPESEEPESEEVVLLSGRDAIAANEGKPHVLWFWGAH